MQYPIIPLVRNKYFPDGHGFGKFRGGRAVSIFYVIRGNRSTILQPTIGGVSLFPISPGLFGGYSPPPAPSVRIKKRKNLDLKNLLTLVLEDPVEFFKGDGRDYDIYTDNYFSGGIPLEEGDMAFYVGFAGPGYGDVLDRDLGLIEKDLKDHSISEWAAEHVYRVAFDPVTLDINPETTLELRKQEVQERLKRGKSFDAFQGEWSKKKPSEDILKCFGHWPFPEEKPEIIEM